MMMQKKTPLGTLVTTYKQDSIYPGFYIDLRDEEKNMLPICNVEYNHEKDCIQVITYGGVNKDEPTNIIDVYLYGSKKGE